MLANLKVSDGDLLIISFKGDVSSAFIDRFKKKLESWIKIKGLINVEIMITSVDQGFEIVKISVNDIFEEQILKGDNNG